MPAPSLQEQDIRCSFCSKSKNDVTKMIAGAGVYICNECVGLCAEILAAESVGTPEISYTESMTVEQILELLPRVAEVGARVEDSLRVWVHRARDRGATWARIGAALGMTRQSAWERFSGEE
ncbi:ClpX C4-type zinc finger protein [Microbispora sp. CA-135349]|uniref:ClpX C4-type zinc finger protein n=1 Tax=Microbispora sp. CA-135349 TaxID=3239953 RepID=UPI003D949285